MREIRQSGSEGGGTGSAGSPYPYQNPVVGGLSRGRSFEAPHSFLSIPNSELRTPNSELPFSFRIPNSEFRIALDVAAIHWSAEKVLPVFAQGLIFSP